jgi:hypothetical protein
MTNKKLYDNHSLFAAYGLINIMLVIFLLVLLVLIFNEIYLLTRIEFVAFIAIHIFLLFFVRIHYLKVFFDQKQKKVEFHYNRRFSLTWLKNSRTVLLPLGQFDGYEIKKDSLGLAIISFYKKKNDERYELGPFVVGFISKRERLFLKESLGESL